MFSLLLTGGCTIKVTLYATSNDMQFVYAD